MVAAFQFHVRLANAGILSVFYRFGFKSKLVFFVMGGGSYVPGIHLTSPTRVDA
jgi:hypothetical protein